MTAEITLLIIGKTDVINNLSLASKAVFVYTTAEISTLAVKGTRHRQYFLDDKVEP